MSRKTSEPLLIFILIVLLMVREYVPYIMSKFALTLSVTLISITFICITFHLGLKPITKYLLLFTVPLFDVFAAAIGWLSGESSVIMVYRFLQFFIWAVVGAYLVKNPDNTNTRRLYIVLLGIFIITTITTYLGNLVLPGASRNMSTGLRDDRQLMALYTSMNIGGFGFVYTLVLFLPFLFYSLKYYSHSLILKLFLIALLIFDYLTIYTTEYSIAVLSAILSLVVLFLPRNLSSKQAISICSILIILGGILSSVLPYLFGLFADNSESYDISIRMRELSEILSGKSTSGDVQARINVWQQSWYNFLNNPLIGTGTSGGDHSFLLDTLSKYGIWGLIIIIIQYRATFNLFVKPYKHTSYYMLFLFVYVLNLFLSIVNTYFYYNIFLLFIPLFMSFHLNDGGKKKMRYGNIHHYNRDFPQWFSGNTTH